MTTELLGKLLERYGVSALLLVGVGWAALWLGENVVTPLTQRHLKFLDATESAISQQTEILRRLESVLSSRASTGQAASR